MAPGAKKKAAAGVPAGDCIEVKSFDVEQTTTARGKGRAAASKGPSGRGGRRGGRAATSESASVEDEKEEMLPQQHRAQGRKGGSRKADVVDLVSDEEAEDDTSHQPKTAPTSPNEGRYRNTLKRPLGIVQSHHQSESAKRTCVTGPRTIFGPISRSTSGPLSPTSSANPEDEVNARGTRAWADFNDAGDHANEAYSEDGDAGCSVAPQPRSQLSGIKPVTGIKPQFALPAQPALPALPRASFTGFQTQSDRLATKEINCSVKLMQEEIGAIKDVLSSVGYGQNEGTLANSFREYGKDADAKQSAVFSIRESPKTTPQVSLTEIAARLKSHPAQVKLVKQTVEQVIEGHLGQIEVNKEQLQEMNDLKARLAASEAEVNKLRHESEQSQLMRKELDDLRQEVAKEEVAHGQRIQELVDQLAAEKKATAAAETESKALTKELKGVCDHCDSAITENHELMIKFEKLNDEAAKNWEVASDLKDEVTSLKRRLDEVNQEGAGSVAEVQSLEARVVELTNELVAAQVECVNLAAESTALRESIAAKEGDKDEEDSEEAAEQLRIDTLQQASDDLDRANKEIADLTAKVEELTKDLDQTRADLARSRDESEAAIEEQLQESSRVWGEMAGLFTVPKGKSEIALEKEREEQARLLEEARKGKAVAREVSAPAPSSAPVGDNDLLLGAGVGSHAGAALSVCGRPITPPSEFAGAPAGSSSSSAAATGPLTASGSGFYDAPAPTSPTQGQPYGDGTFGGFFVPAANDEVTGRVAPAPTRAERRRTRLSAVTEVGSSTGSPGVEGQSTGPTTRSSRRLASKDSTPFAAADSPYQE